MSNKAVKSGVCLTLLTLSYGLFSTDLSESSYKLSIYSEFSAAFWVSIALIVCVGFFLLISNRDGANQMVGLTMVTLAIVLFSSLPLLNGYQMYGQFDSLSHLGIVIDILNGFGSNIDVLYPATHILASAFVLIGGASPNSALMMTVPVFVLTYVIGCAALFRRMPIRDSSFGWGVASLTLLLPIMTVRLPEFNPVPSTFAIFVSPIFLYVVWRLPHIGKAGTILTVILFTFLTILHPQVAIVFLISSIVITGLKYITSKYDGGISIGRRTGGKYYTNTVLLFLIFASWVSAKEAFTGSAWLLLSGIFENEGGIGVSSASVSLQAVGGSIMEIFFKVFFVKLVAGLFVAVVIIYSLAKRRDRHKDRFLMQLLVILVAVSTPFFLSFTAVGRFEQSLRYVGLIFIFVSIAIPMAVDEFTDIVSRSTQLSHMSSVRLICGILLVVAVVSSSAAAYKSPYVYQQNRQVSDSQLTGYEFAYTHQDESDQFTAVLSIPHRNRNAIFGKYASSRGVGMVPTSDIIYQFSDRRLAVETNMPPHFDNRTLHEVNEPIFVVSTAYAKKTYLDLYKGQQFSESDFRYLSERFNRVYSNGGFQLHKSPPKPQ